MKKLLEKLSCVRGSQWLLLLLALSLLLWMAFPNIAEDHTEMTDTEKRIAALLSRIEGAGEVRVILLTQAQEGTFGNSQEETILGSVVVAGGGEDIAVRVKLFRAMQALTGLSADKIEIFSMEEK